MSKTYKQNRVVMAKSHLITQKRSSLKSKMLKKAYTKQSCKNNHKMGGILEKLKQINLRYLIKPYLTFIKYLLKIIFFNESSSLKRQPSSLTRRWSSNSAPTEDQHHRHTPRHAAVGDRGKSEASGQQLPPLMKGTLVQVNYQGGGKYYTGIITRVHHGSGGQSDDGHTTYDIAYDARVYKLAQGNREEHVPASMIRKILTRRSSSLTRRPSSLTKFSNIRSNRTEFNNLILNLFRKIIKYIKKSFLSPIYSSPIDADAETDSYKLTECKIYYIIKPLINIYNTYNFLLPQNLNVYLNQYLDKKFYINLFKEENLYFLLYSERNTYTGFYDYYYYNSKKKETTPHVNTTDIWNPLIFIKDLIINKFSNLFSFEQSEENNINIDSINNNKVNDFINALIELLKIFINNQDKINIDDEQNLNMEEFIEKWNKLKNTFLTMLNYYINIIPGTSIDVARKQIIKQIKDAIEIKITETKTKIKTINIESILVNIIRQNHNYIIKYNNEIKRSSKILIANFDLIIKIITFIFNNNIINITESELQSIKFFIMEILTCQEQFIDKLLPS